VSTVLPTVIYELGLTGTAVAQLMTMVSSISPSMSPLRGSRLEAQGIQSS
jgi:hypothetical protein